MMAEMGKYKQGEQDKKNRSTGRLADDFSSLFE